MQNDVFVSGIHFKYSPNIFHWGCARSVYTIYMYVCMYNVHIMYINKRVCSYRMFIHTHYLAYLVYNLWIKKKYDLWTQFSAFNGNMRDQRQTEQKVKNKEENTKLSQKIGKILKLKKCVFFTCQRSTYFCLLIQSGFILIYT